MFRGRPGSYRLHPNHLYIQIKGTYNLRSWCGAWWVGWTLRARRPHLAVVSQVSRTYL